MMSSRLRLLDLYSGAGGCAAGYDQAGFDVTGVDIAEQPRYPFRHIVADALEYVAEHGHEYDVIHASPPCQKHLKGLGAVNEKLGRISRHVDLVEATREALRATGKPYVIENVVGAPLHSPVKLCGSSFGLAVRRHRLFESNLLLHGAPCRHDLQREAKYWTSFRGSDKRVRRATVVQVYGDGGETHLWAEAMGITWMDRKELTQAIPPSYTRFLGDQIAMQMEMAS